MWVPFQVYILILCDIYKDSKRIGHLKSGKTVAWSDESQCLLRHTNEFGVRIWCQQHESMDISCFELTVQADLGTIIVWGMISWPTTCQLRAVNHQLNATAYISIVT